jgi:hypothetical protein
LDEDDPEPPSAEASRFRGAIIAAESRFLDDAFGSYVSVTIIPILDEFGANKFEPKAAEALEAEVGDDNESSLPLFVIPPAPLSLATGILIVGMYEEEDSES